MRFYAYYGASVRGPATVEDLVKLPGFKANTLVCPEGARTRSDWKPAQAYPPFSDVFSRPAEPPPLPAAAAASATGKKALICDDNGAITLLIQTLLGGEDLTVLTAADGVQGLAAINRERPDCVVLDLDMPEKDGLSVLADLKGQGGRMPYVIVLSAHESDSTHEKAKALGAREVMIKPFSMAELIGRVKKALNASEAP